MTYLSTELAVRVPPEVLELRNERRRKRLTQKDVADAMGVRVDQLANWELGRRPMKIASLIRYRQELENLGEVTLPGEMRAFRERMGNITQLAAAAMAGVPAWAWAGIETTCRTTRRSKYAAKLQAFLKRWEGKRA